MKTAKLVVGDGERNSDVRYLSGFSAPDEFILFEAPDGRRTAVVSELEFSRAAAEAAPGVEVRRQDLVAPTRVDVILTLARECSAGTLVVPGSFPLILADRLRAAGLTVTPAAGEFCPQRRFKTPREAECVREAMRATQAGMQKALDLLSAADIADDGSILLDGSPLTSERLRRAIEVEFIQNGASAASTIVAGGLQSAQPHCEGYGALRAHTPIVMDLFPRHLATGYWGDLTRTVVKGSAPEIVKRAFNAVRAARDLAKSLVRPGAIPADIHNRARDLLTAAGFPTGASPDGAPYGFFHGLGHGVGLDIHESPRLSPRNRIPLLGGEIVTVEPGVYYPQWGGVRLEDVVYVTPGGSQCLTSIPTFLEIP